MKMLVCSFLLFTFIVVVNGVVFVYSDFNNYKNDLVASGYSPLFRFGYHLNGVLKMRIFLMNKPENVRVEAYLKYSIGYSVNFGQKKYEIIEKENYFEIVHRLVSRNITIGLALSKNSGFCTSKEIIKAGVQARQLLQDKFDETYYDICLKDEPCIVVVDLSRCECKDPKFAAEPTTASTTVQPVTDGDSFNTTFTKFTDINSDKIETTTGKITEDGPNESNIVSIVLPVSCIAIILVIIIIVLWKCRWNKCNQSGTPQLPINEPSDPFYLNMLFRRECDREIADIEQHEYAEIGELIYDEVRNEYEIIHPKELVTDPVASTSSSGKLPEAL